MSDKKYELEIECTDCLELNKIKVDNELKCKKCEKPLVGKSYKNPIISSMLLLLIGSGIGITSDNYLNINRPSVKTEYFMMQTCLKEYSNENNEYSEEIRDNCICAVETMSGIIDAQKARIYGESWLKEILVEKYESCNIK